MPFRLAISATFTAEPVEPVLAFWGRQLASPFEVRFAPYNQIVQTLMDPSGEFVSNLHGANIVLMRLEDLAQFDRWDSGALSRIESNLDDLIGAIRDTPQRTSVPLMVVLCPPSPGFLADPERARFAHAAAMRAEAMLDGTPGVFYVSHGDIGRLYPVAEPFNREGERLGRIPYTDLYFCALGTALVRMTHGFLLPPFKVIALDCDNTLWRGICGEDGPQGIVVDPPRRKLQEFMADQRESGMLLVMASKNNEQDVIEAFSQNPGMPLQLRHFLSWRLNWDSKSASLSSLANQLSFGLDSFIFVDDNPKECAEVEDSVPEVLALVLPADEALIPHFLEHVWVFDHVLITEEDRNRNAYYAQAQEFGREVKQASSLEHFLETLDLRVRLEPVSSDRLARVAQLTQRTNQFNFAGVRRTEAEIRALLAEKRLECLTVDVSDRFGDYGLTGVIFFRVIAGALDIDTMLLSCRILGRGVEHQVMAHLGEVALRRGLDTVIAPFVPTSKNEPARKFLQEIGASLEEITGSGLRYRLPAAQLRSLRWRPSMQEATTPPAGPAAKPASIRRRPDYARIANTLSTSAQILEAVRRESHSAEPSLDTGMADTEARLAAIWRELLRRPAVAAGDNFFDLGGHSLLVVLMIVRVREAFGVELPIEDVYSAGLTLGELARKIDAYQLGGPAEYEALLREIEGMSDDEVKRLLAEEDPGVSRP